MRSTPYGMMPGGGPGLRGTLVGCANADRVGLSSVERNRCNQRLGAGAPNAPALSGISPDKRQQYDAQAAQDEANRRYRNATPTGTAPDAAGTLGPPKPQ
jgi:hypothetical protein